jgi:hypothetical protein
MTDNRIPGSGVGLPGDLADCLVVRMQVPVHQIDYVCRLVEAHEDLGLVRTENGTTDVLEFWIPRGMYPDGAELLGSLIEEGLGTILSGPEPMPDGWLKDREW